MNIELGNFGREDREHKSDQKIGVLHETVQKRGEGGNECKEMME